MPITPRPLRRRASAAAAVLAIAAASLSALTAEAAPLFEQRFAAARGFEQGINVLPNGIVYVDEPPGVPNHGRLWKSTDGGRTYSELLFSTPWNRFRGGGDTDVVLSHDDRVYFLDLYGGSNAITVSKDGGQTWAHGNPLTGIPTSDRQWIGLGRRDPVTDEDTVYIIHSKLLLQPDWTWIGRSRDGGLTWTYHAPVVFDPVDPNDPLQLGSPQGPTGNLVSDGPFLAFPYEDGGRMWVVTSNDEGETWTRSFLTTGAADNIPSIALDGQHLHVSWVSRDSRRVLVASSSDRGTTWSAPKVIVSGGTSVFSWVAARDGKVGVAWYRSDAQVRLPDNVTAADPWRVEYAESLDGGASFTGAVTVMSPVKAGPVCTQGLNCNTTGSGGREFGDFIALEIDFDGNALIAHYGNGSALVSRQIAPVP